VPVYTCQMTMLPDTEAIMHGNRSLFCSMGPRRQATRSLKMSAPSDLPFQPGSNGLNGDGIPILRCELCGLGMTHLGDLPGRMGKASIRVFRCYPCNRIVSHSC